MTSNLDLFRQEFLGANSWAQRKDGVPLHLLDNLSAEEREVAEAELIKGASLRDDWPVLGLGHIKSINALPVLNRLLAASKGAMKIKLAHSIFQISGNEKMVDIVLETLPGITGEHELVDVLYYLPFFKNEKLTGLLHSYRHHKNYLVAYNATRYLELPTDEVVARFRNKNTAKAFWKRLFR